MFEINYLDDENFESYKNIRKVYKDGLYDFTFEDRFIVYHNKLKDKIQYYAFDKTTGLSSRVSSENKLYDKKGYEDMIPNILNSIKYTGDTRYKTLYEENPLDVIDKIFRKILPAYGYTIREEQIELCKNMYYSFTEKQVSLCEAEVGSGKTLAYLIAAYMAKIHYASEYDKILPVTISTATIELQKHLVEKEIPQLSRILLDNNLINRPFITVLRKGKEHYLCKRRLNELAHDLESNGSKNEKLMFAVEMLKKGSCGFDLDNYSISKSIKNKVCVKDGCISCKLQSECRYSRLIKDTINSSIVDFQITNHNLYLMAHKTKKSNSNMKLLKNSDFIILDEAHKIKDVAQDVFGERLNEKDILKFVSNVKTLCNETTNPKTYKSWLRELLEENNYFFEDLKQMKVFEDETNENHIVLSVTNRYHQRLKRMIDLLENICTHKSKKNITSQANGEKIITALKAMSYIKENTIWLEVDENNVVSLCCCPNNIEEIMKKKLWESNSSFVLTSGTMSDGKNFEYFKKELGIDKINPSHVFETSYESPFDFKSNAKVYIPQGMPRPDNGSEEYINAISQEILKIIKVTNGHTAILFTSYKILSLVYNKIQAELKQYDVITMTRGDKKAISNFKKSQNAILFASGSIYEGINCPGDTLSSVIIVKLPFPIRNVLNARKKESCSEIAEFIENYCTPDMLIKLRQGMGRLIRTETDTGVVSILDPRVKSPLYAEKIDNIISKYGKVKSIREIQEFFTEVKSKEYFST